MAERLLGSGVEFDDLAFVIANDDAIESGIENRSLARLAFGNLSFGLLLSSDVADNLGSTYHLSCIILDR